MLRYTFPNYKDYLALKSAVLNVQKVVNEVQSIRKQSKNFEEINRIQKKLTGNVPVSIQFFFSTLVYDIY